MLKIRHSHRFSVPHVRHGSQPMALSGPIPEDDELIQAIESDRNRENWTLSHEPDVRGLENFWADVQADISRDPTWFTFTE